MRKLGDTRRDCRCTSKGQGETDTIHKGDLGRGNKWEHSWDKLDLTEQGRKNKHTEHGIKDCQSKTESTQTQDLDRETGINRETKGETQGD